MELLLSTRERLIQKRTSNLLFRQFDSVSFSIMLRKEGVGFYLFVFVFILGRLIRISRGDWIGVWFGLEINLFGVVPFFAGAGMSEELESVSKYFIMQAVGSIILLAGRLVGFLYVGSIFLNYSSFLDVSCFLVVVGLIVKMGLVPFHFWIPRVIKGIRWIGCLVLRVWQKVAPLFVLIRFVDGFIVKILVAFSCLGRVVGGLGGFLQTQLRILLGYSSIGHSGWIVAGGIYSVTCCICYFIIYTIISVILFFVLRVVEVVRYSSLRKSYSLVDVKLLRVLVFLLVSLAGLPPTLGFAMKWSVFLAVLPNSFVVLGILVFGSLLRLYYYLCLGFSWYIFSFSSVWSFPTVSFGILGLFLVILASVILGYGGFLAVRLLCL